jgi:hypothetical protein
VYPKAVPTSIIIDTPPETSEQRPARKAKILPFVR